MAQRIQALRQTLTYAPSPVKEKALLKILRARWLLPSLGLKGPQSVHGAAVELLQDNCNELPRGQSRCAAKQQRSPVVWLPSKIDTRRPHHDSLTPHSALATIQHPATSGGAFKTQRRPLAATRASSSRSSAPGPACARRVRGRRGRKGGGHGGARPEGSPRAREARAGEPAPREDVLLFGLEAPVRSRAAVPGP